MNNGHFLIKIQPEGTFWSWIHSQDEKADIRIS